MELELVKKEGTTIELKVIGEDHTFCNPIRKNLHDDDRVETAAYAIAHPILEHPKITVGVKKGISPTLTLKKAAEKLAADCVEVREKLSKALKN